jgi:hypothetical protein
MSQIHRSGDHRSTTQGLNQQAPGSLKGANKSHKVTVGCGPGTGRKGNFFTKLALKVSDFARSIFSATAALERKIEKTEKTEIRKLTEKYSKIAAEINAPIKAKKKAEIEAKIKELKKEIKKLEMSLSYERNREPFKLEYDSAVADAEKELADAREKLKEAESQLNKIK